MTVSLPPVPNVPQKPVKAGDAYTVWGASYQLRSRVHHKDVADKDLKITGYISKTNLADAPACAIHKTGKEDPEGCRPPIPTFWLCDSKDAVDADCMRVMGWASNFAQLHDAIEQFDKEKGKPAAAGKEKEAFTDNFWGVKVPDPLPAKGAKVNVKGNYATTFTKATSGTVADPIMGVLTYAEIETVEQAPEEATLPGMKRKK
ncbi:MAG TPA: hypothetical protein VH062_08160 [Polyangiaceae bacterium]|nr:hypothetical protein [Polyangiaceae bacterium]